MPKWMEIAHRISDSYERNQKVSNSHFHTSHSSIDTNMAILLGAALKTAAEEVNPRAAPAGPRAASRPH